MNRESRLSSFVVLLTALLPSSASALTLAQFVGLFHVVTGLLLTATLGIFAVGVVIYFARLNTWPSYRDISIKVLIWAVLMLFILILFVALVQFIQTHTALALTILGVIVIVGVLILIAWIAGAGQKKKPPPRPTRPGPPGQ